MDRKTLKRRAKRNLKSHYLLFVALCLAAAILGAEFSGSLYAISAFSQERSQAEEGTATTGLTIQPKVNLSNVVLDLLWGEEEEAKQASDELIEQAEDDSASGNSILGRSRGIFAFLVNGVTSGSILTTLTAAMSSLVHSESLGFAILVLLGASLVFAFWFFIRNIYTAISRRMILEGRLYKKVPLSRMLFFLRVKKWGRVSCTMFLTSFYHFLWSLTVIGGVIKRYSYYLVPYLAAENPALSPRETIGLSRRMMQGHKWECFVWELSFLGWRILGVLTAGITAIFYSNPYETATFTEYYTEIRERYIEAVPEAKNQLHDQYLYERADDLLLKETYADVLQQEEAAALTPELKGFRGFLARNFGVVLSWSPAEKAWEQAQEEKALSQLRQDAAEGRAYPARLYSIPETEKRTRLESVHYLRSYSIWSLLAMFFIFSFVGWVWEVSLHLISEHAFVNRGILQGPWLPIYGFGALLILVLLHRFRSRPAVEFLCAVALCGLVEYFTAYFMEITHDGHKWWDYSGYFLNLHGRICAEGLLVFGLGGIAVVYFLAPLLDDLLRKLPIKVLAPITLALLALFVSDQAYSSGHPNMGKGITDEVSANTAQISVGLVVSDKTKSRGYRDE